MVTSTKRPNKRLVFPENWKKEQHVYAGDDLIEAYLKGRQDGKNEITNILSNTFEENIKKATAIAEKLFNSAANKKIEFTSVHLKSEGIASFTSIFLVRKDDFISDKFRNILVLGRKLKKELENENIYITFSFAIDDKGFSEKKLISDGYFLKYAKK
jgi:hypothetical protein